MCSDVTGDRHAVQNRLDRLEVGTRHAAPTNILAESFKYS